MVFKFKIQIEWISNPPVWREVEVPASFSFKQFHKVIQTIFGWDNYHLWMFEPVVKKRHECPAFRIEILNDDDWPVDDAEILSPDKTRLEDIFPRVKELVYTYDYGDDWKHTVTLEKVIDEEREYAVCTAGRGTTPPEDCGGIPGYEALKEAFASHSDEVDSYRDWLGLADDESWNPDEFDGEWLAVANRDLKRIKAPAAK